MVHEHRNMAYNGNGAQARKWHTAVTAQGHRSKIVSMAIARLAMGTYTVIGPFARVLLQNTHLHRKVASDLCVLSQDEETCQCHPQRD